MVKRIRSALSGEGGFSLAEVLVAGLILVLAVFPMVGMFDGAFLVSKAAYDINISSECLQLYAEQVRNMPFYVPHTEDNITTPLDLDDFYWGARTPENNNSWSDAPDVVMKPSGAEPYPEFEVTLKISYIDEEIVSGMSLEDGANATVMANDWEPMALYGYDRPKSNSGKPLTLILYEVKVTTESGRFYTNTQLYASPTDVVANVYIDRVINVSADTAKLGTRYNSYGDCISAPHDENNITIRAYGEGFTQSDLDGGLVDLKMVRVEDTDIQVLPVSGVTLTYGEEGSEKYLEGLIDLADDNGDEEPWGPDYRMPGHWHAWLVVNHIISVKNNAFIVEYPVPVYDELNSGFTDSDGDKQGEESSTNEELTFTDLDYVMSFVTGEYPNPGVGAVLQLIHTVEENGIPIDVIEAADLAINPSASDGYQTGLTVTASFDFTGHIGGNYKIRMINCMDRATPSIDVPGNTYFELDAGPYYYLEGPPALNQAYVYEATPLTASPRHFGYDDRSYPYTLEIKGFNFDNLIAPSDIKLGLGGDTGVDPPVGDNEVEALAVDIIDTETLRATFDFAPSVEETERGMYWLYVRNSNGFGNVLQPAFDVRAPAPIIYSYSYDTLGPWQNYYGVGLSVVGECFDVDSLAGTYVDVMIKEVADPLNDWLATEAMSDPAASADGTLLTCELNLVDCDIGDWELYVMSQPALLTDSGYTDAIGGVTYQSFVDVEYGTPVLLTQGVPASGEPWSVRITSRYRGCDDAGVWGDWSAWQTSTEGSGSMAWAWENDPNHDTINYKTEGEMYFVELRGMGFNKDGTIDISCIAKNDLPPKFPLFKATWSSITVQCDRANALVFVVMDETMKKFSGPDEGGYVDMEIKNNTTGDSSVKYINRFYFRSEG
ncbi:MAG: hypothetical protein JW854_13540 [Actinobacteria bacterium]|nr:hypothetical protein [Actinomycetota bacterium]